MEMISVLLGTPKTTMGTKVTPISNCHTDSGKLNCAMNSSHEYLGA